MNQLIKNDNKDIYKNPRISKFWQLLPSIVFFPLSIFAIAYLYLVDLPININKGMMDSTEWTLLIILTIGILFGMRSLFIYTVGLWKLSEYIKLEKDRIVAKNIWDNQSEIKFDDITEIKKHKRHNWIIVKSIKNVINVSVDINNFGTCIESIARKASNAKEIDYGGLDKKPEIWQK